MRFCDTQVSARYLVRKCQGLTGYRHASCPDHHTLVELGTLGIVLSRRSNTDNRNWVASSAGATDVIYCRSNTEGSEKREHIYIDTILYIHIYPDYLDLDHIVFCTYACNCIHLPTSISILFLLISLLIGAQNISMNVSWFLIRCSPASLCLKATRWNFPCLFPGEPKEGSPHLSNT